MNNNACVGNSSDSEAKNVNIYMCKYFKKITNNGVMFGWKIWTFTMKTDLTNQIYEIKKNLEDIKIIPHIFTKIVLDRWLEIDKECAKISRIIDVHQKKYCYW